MLETTLAMVPGSSLGIVVENSTDAADPHDHRPVPRHKGFESQLARLVPIGQEPIEQCSVGHSSASSSAEKRPKVLCERLSR